MIYLDNAGTTAVYPRVADMIKTYLTTDFFNASATYKPALAIRSAIDLSRAKIARFLGADAGEIFFTSCATESNNLAIKNGCRSKNGNIIISAGEHASVYESAKWMESKGFDVRIAALKEDGSVDIDDLMRKTDEKTCLISVLHVSNETGVINDLKLIADSVKRVNPRAVIHADGVQAFLKTYCNVRELGVDMYSISGHKFHAPKGVGALFIDKKLHLQPFLAGGGQEGGMRSGTENVAGINALAMAAEIFSDHYDKNTINENYNTLVNCLKDIPDCVIIGNQQNNTHLITAVSFLGCKAEILQSMMADEGVIVGRGSACSSRHAGNRVLESMGLPKKMVEGTLRFSMCPETQKQEIIDACEILSKKVQKLRGNKIG